MNKKSFLKRLTTLIFAGSFCFMSTVGAYAAEPDNEEAEVLVAEDELLSDESENELIVKEDFSQTDEVTDEHVTVTFSVEDGKTKYDPIDTSAIKVADPAEGVTTVLIKKEGSYTVTGQAVNTIIAIEGNLKKNGGVTLELKDLSIDNTKYYETRKILYPTVMVKESDSIVNLVISGTNTIKSNKTCDPDDDSKAVIRATKGELHISGDGVLGIWDEMSDDTANALAAKGKEPTRGIGAKGGKLFIDGGTINLWNIKGEAVKANAGEININGGRLNIIECRNDGIKAKGSDGFVNINGGEININLCEGDGIQAGNIYINGGTVNIDTVYKDSAVSFYGTGTPGTDTARNYLWKTDNTKYERVNVDLGSHKALNGGTSKIRTVVFLEGDPDGKHGKDESQDRASGGIFITGGTINLDTTKTGLKAKGVTTEGYTPTDNGAYMIGSPDTAIHSNNKLEITGGDITVKASGNGVSGIEKVYLEGSGTVLDIRTCYEGIEGKDITIGEAGVEGPTVRINSREDGINASNKKPTYKYDSYDAFKVNDEIGLTKEFESTLEGKCNIYSGDVRITIDSNNVDGGNSTDLYAGDGVKTISFVPEGDGIDCNGSLDLYGGRVTIFGDSSDKNSPVDTDTQFMIHEGAKLLAAGGYKSIENLGLPETGNRYYVGAIDPYEAGTVFSVYNVSDRSDSYRVYTTKLPYAGALVIFADPDVLTGNIDDYEPYIGDYMGGEWEVLDEDIPASGIFSKIWVSEIKDQVYTGAAIKPDIRVYDGTTMLVEKTDYTLSYKNNKKAYKVADKKNPTAEDKQKAPSVTVNMKGNYSGQKTVYFSITDENGSGKTDLPKVALSKVTVGKIPDQVYKGVAYTGSDLKNSDGSDHGLDVKYQGKKLTQGTDFEILTVQNGKNAGTATLVLRGRQAPISETGYAFTGEKTVTFKITGKPINSEGITINSGDPVSVQYESGQTIPSVVVRDGSVKLKEGRDYTIKCTNNNKVASAADLKPPTITITGKGNYSKTKYVNFSITESVFARNTTVIASDVTASAKAGKFKAKVTVRDRNGNTLRAGKDYEKVIKYYKEDKTTEVSDTENPPAGTLLYAAVTGMGNYMNQTVFAPYRILAAKKDISKAKFSIKDQTYTGREILITKADQFSSAKLYNTDLVLNAENGFEVVPGSYINNVKKGTAQVTLHGTGEFGGYKTVKFKIGTRL